MFNKSKCSILTFRCLLIIMQKGSNNTFGFYFMGNPILVIGGKYKTECKNFFLIFFPPKSCVSLRLVLESFHGLLKTVLKMIFISPVIFAMLLTFIGFVVMIDWLWVWVFGFILQFTHTYIKREKNPLVF